MGRGLENLEVAVVAGEQIRRPIRDASHVQARPPPGWRGFGCGPDRWRRAPPPRRPSAECGHSAGRRRATSGCRNRVRLPKRRCSCRSRRRWTCTRRGRRVPPRTRRHRTAASPAPPNSSRAPRGQRGPLLVGERRPVAELGWTFEWRGTVVSPDALQIRMVVRRPGRRPAVWCRLRAGRARGQRREREHLENRDRSPVCHLMPPGVPHRLDASSTRAPPMKIDTSRFPSWQAYSNIT